MNDGRLGPSHFKFANFKQQQLVWVDSFTGLAAKSRQQFLGRLLAGGQLFLLSGDSGREFDGLLFELVGFGADQSKFLVKVDLENEDELVVPGSTGVAKIRAGSQTVGRRIWRLASRTFQFEL